MPKRPEDDATAARVRALAGELHTVLGKLKRRLREQASAGELTSSQISVLGRIEREGPATVTALARAERMRPQSMGANIAALEAAGLVQGSPDPADGRQTLLSLTDACRDWMRAGRAARADWLLRAIQEHLAPAEQEQLAHAVELLQRIADS
jgi:DNA-binding MarR family transcriptional regulator